MRILIACEYSGRVREAFRKLGHDAWSCDLLPSDDSSPYHIQGNVLEILNDGWDMMIAHPPCTYLSVVAAKHLYKGGVLNEERYQKGVEGAEFFRKLLEAPIPKICVENPVQFKIFELPKYDQIIHPYYFGEPFQKRTCLWLKGLPPLVWDKEKAVKPPPLFHLKTNGKPINWVEGLKGMSSKDRWKVRSTTFQSIANAMAEQWGSRSPLIAPKPKGVSNG